MVGGLELVGGYCWGFGLGDRLWTGGWVAFLLDEVWDV